MSKSNRRQEAMAKRRAAKEARMTKAGGKGTSVYAEKLSRKMGSGKRKIGWMWWTQAEGAPERELAVA
jgi:hypothetical protein